MIKKGFIFLILAALSFLSVARIHVQASATFSIFDDKTSFTFIWDRMSAKPADGSGGSYIQKANIYINEAYIGHNIEINTMMTINGIERQVFQRSNIKKTSEIQIYSENYMIGLVDTYYFNYADGDLSTMKAYNASGQLFNPLHHVDQYMTIKIAISDGILYADYLTIVETLKANPKDYITVNFVMNPIEINPEDPSALPETIGSIFNDSTQVGRVTHTVDGRDVNFKILYQGVMYNLDYTFSATTDMSIFERTYEIYYFTYDQVKYMLFNHGEESMFTRASGDTFIPYTLWNMETNEIATFERYNVYTYLRKEAGMTAVAYFYVDQFVIDNILSATVSMEYRYVNILGVKLDWQPYMKILENDIHTDPSVSWKMIAASISTAATTLGAMSGVGWPLFLLGTAVSGYLQYKTYEELTDSGIIYLGGTNEIKPVLPNASLLGEINTAYAKMYDDFSPVVANQEYKIFKLSLGSFNKFFMDKIEVKNDSFNIASFTYVTNDNFYVEVASEDYNVIVNPGDLVETPDNDSNIFQQILDFFQTWGTYIFITLGVIAGGFILFWISKSSSSLYDVFSNPGKVIIFGVIVLAILKFLKVI